MYVFKKGWCADLRDVDEVDGAEVLDLFCAPEQGFVHLHAVRVPVVPEPDEHYLILLT